MPLVFGFFKGIMAVMACLIMHFIFFLEGIKEVLLTFQFSLRFLFSFLFLPCHRIDNWKREHVLQFLREKVKAASAI